MRNIKKATLCTGRLFLKISLLISLLSTNVTITNAQQPDSRTKWFADSRFGMFIHWGLYSAAEGIWQGEGLRYANNYAEWLRYRNRISKEEYGQLASRFKWDKINPEEWVLLAKKAGMKYIIITAKHHDGVAIWNSKVSDYNLSRLAHTNRDVIKELADACKKHGLKLGFYYSHWLDWEHPYGWDHNQEIGPRVTNEQYNKYWQEKVIPQLRELPSDYGDVAMLWFDMWVDYKTTIVKKEQLEQVIKLVKELQPNCLINSRLGLPPGTPGIDFETMGDNEFSSIYQNHVWETPGTIAHSWGYNALENEWKSTSQLLQSLTTNVSLNGGFTLNIGPRADGSVPYEGITRLADMGAWLSKNGASVYGSSGLTLRPRQHDWGRITTKQDISGRQQVYLQVYNWPLDHILRLTGILSTPERVELITAGGKKELSFIRNGPLTHIQLPDEAGDKFISTIIVHYAQPVDLNTKVVAESTFGGFALNSENILENTPGYKLVKYDGLHPTHLIMNKEGEISWQLYVPEAGSYTIDLSYHNHSKVNAQVLLSCSEQTLRKELKPGGKMVAEPHSSYNEDFVSEQLGNFTFREKGVHTIVFKTTAPKDPQIWFNHLWMNIKTEK